MEFGTAWNAQHMHIYSKDTQIEIDISNTNSNNSNKLINDSAMDTLSTLNEKLFQGHTTKKAISQTKLKHSGKQQGLCQGLYQVRATGARSCVILSVLS